MTTAGPIFAKYQPQAVFTVPGGYHATCTAETCIHVPSGRRPARYIGTGGEYVVVGGKAQHLACNARAHDALLKQAQLDASTPPVSESEVADS